SPCIVSRSMPAPLHPHAFFSDPPPSPPIYTLSLHDALPIFSKPALQTSRGTYRCPKNTFRSRIQEIFQMYFLSFHSLFCFLLRQDRKSTRLNSSHVSISYAVFCLKKKNIEKNAVARVAQQDA